MKEGSNKEGMNEAELIFLETIMQLAGGFNAQHQMELTNARGLKMLTLQNRKILRDTTSKAFQNDPVLHARAIEIINWWFKMATGLFPIGTILKSQKKCTTERFQTLKLHVAKYGIAWRKKITWKKNPVFWKMHVLECCGIRYIDHTGITGLGNTEGSEAKHYVITGLKTMLAPVVKTEHRVQNLVQRQQISLVRGLSKKLEIVESKKKKRVVTAPYKSKAASRVAEEAPILSDEEDEESDLPAGYFATKDDGILPLSLQPAYLFYKYQKAPAAWSESFADVDDLGSKAKSEIMYIN
jgi:hypothetical protein